jgi:ribosome-binding ATPase YchF (GTP1/OBG family)
VGYTNAGKSTLLNQLTGADVLAEDKLFATLDPTTRRVQVSKNFTWIISKFYSQPIYIVFIVECFQLLCCGCLSNL